MLRWLVIGLALAIQLYVVSSSGGIENAARALQFTALVVVYNSALLVLRAYVTNREHRIWLAVMDAVIVGLLTGFGGGIYSPFVFLVYLIIVEASQLFTPSGLLTYTAVTAMFYAIAAMLLPGQQWNELSITIVLSLVLGMFIWASVCGAISKALEQERALVKREKALTAELNRQVVALSSLNRLTERLNASLNLDELMQSTVKELPDALEVDACVAFLADYFPDESTWKLDAVWYGVDEDFEPAEVENGSKDDENGEWLKIGPLLLSRNDLEAVLEEGVILRQPKYTSEELEQIEDPDTNYPSVLVVPLTSEDGSSGALALLRQQGPAFTLSDQEIVASLARQLSLMAKNARLYEMERRNVARLQELEEMKSEFLSTVSHELRTPLTSIKASTILMLSQASSHQNETTDRLLHNIDRNTERLSGLVSDILDMAKLQNGRLKISPKPLCLAEVALDVATTLRPLTDSKRQQLDLEIAPNLKNAYADRRRLEQIITNLLSNAQRYTQKGGHIKLSVIEKAGELQVSIQDNGPGIPLHEQELIFERFYRIHGGKGGTGLGLAIARSLVELHGGRLWVESQPGAGSTFYFTLPIATKIEPALSLAGSLN